MEAQKFQVAATIHKIETMVDGENKIVVFTQKLLPDEAATLFGMKSLLGWFMFSPSPFKAKDVPLEPVPEFKNQKSPSQRLYNVMLVYYKTKTKQEKSFEEFRREQMEKIIEFWKGKLD